MWSADARAEALVCAHRTPYMFTTPTSICHGRLASKCLWKLFRFCAEQTLTINTAAAGGNATLLAGESGGH